MLHVGQVLVTPFGNELRLGDDPQSPVRDAPQQLRAADRGVLDAVSRSRARSSARSSGRSCSSPVVTAISVSPSLSVAKGWIAR